MDTKKIIGIIFFKTKKLFLKSKDTLSTTFNFLLILVVTTLSALLVLFTLTQIYTTLNQDAGKFKSASDKALQILGINPLQDQLGYNSILATLTGSIAVLVTIWFTILTTKKYLDNKKIIRKKSPIQKERIITDEVDDLEIMSRHYKKASNVIVFSGDFSWITKSKDLEKEILRLANEDKISFISYKSEQNVKNAISSDEKFEKLKSLFTFDSNIEIKCSLIQKSQKLIFLYKTNGDDEDNETNICSLVEKGDSRYLLKALDIFCKSLTRN